MQIVYVRGGDKTAPEIARLSGMAYGSRNDYKVYSDDVYMIDIEWDAYHWPRYLDVIRRHKPQVAMVADWLPGIPVAQVYRQIADLEALGISRVMVCPKFEGAVADIDRKYIVAISVPTRYAGFLPQSSEVEGRDVHLLGGHPDQQAYCMTERYRYAQVVTADGNILARKANEWGAFWSADKGDWQDMRAQGCKTRDLAVRSGLEIRDYLARPQPRWDMRKDRMQKCIEYMRRLL